MKTYTVVYFGSVLLALAITPVVIWLARRVNAVDMPGVRKVHVKPVSNIGGVAIFLSMMCLTIPVLILPNVVGEAFRDILPEVTVLLSTAGFMFCVGLIDDIKGLRARVKFLAQLAAAITVCAVGIRIESVAVADWLTLDFGWFSWPLTLLWIVGITNAVNLSDGLDGLATGISAVACAVIAVFAVYSGQVIMAVLMLALLGSLTGFLFYNFNPARMFMGDCGSLFLGFTIASSSVLCSAKSSALVGLALPVLALGIPIFDTLFSMLRRFLGRRSLFAPDRSHFHHKLLDLGLKQRHAVIIAYSVTLLAAGLGMFMMLTQNIGSLIVFLCVLLLLLLVFRVVGSVRFQEVITGLQKKYAMSHQVRDEINGFENAELYFRRATTFDQWWQAVCIAAEQLDFVSIKLPLISSDKPPRTLTWQKDGNGPTQPETVKMRIPIREMKAESRCSLEVDVNVDGSLESAGHRATLFSRLLDEHSMLDFWTDGTRLPHVSKERTIPDH